MSATNRHNKAQAVPNSRLLLVPAAVEHLDKMATDVAEYDVTVTMLTETELIATVRLSSTRTAIVSLRKQVLGSNGAVMTEASATCSICKKHDDTGLLCPEMVAAVSSSNNAMFGNTWSLYDMQFATVERHTSRWLEQVSVDVPLFPFTPVDQSSGDLPLDNTYGETPVLSWKHPPPRTGANRSVKRIVKQSRKQERCHQRARITAVAVGNLATICRAVSKLTWIVCALHGVFQPMVNAELPPPLPVE